MENKKCWVCLNCGSWNGALPKTFNKFVDEKLGNRHYVAVVSRIEYDEKIDAWI